ncbi:MAG: flagellar hook-length control protein FliK [Lentisphaerae bacterium]|nr:flagellar hook-length control protein FliK [Lentisphaerota bacterium]
MKLQEFMDRFDRHSAAAAAEKDGSMTIKLIPDNLGKVSLNCREANGVLQMQVVVENQGVRTLLAQHETAIRHLLEQAGIQLSSFDVRTQQEGPGSRQLNGRGQGQNGLGGRQVEAVTAGELEEAAPEAPAYWSREQTQMWIA